MKRTSLWFFIFSLVALALSGLCILLALFLSPYESELFSEGPEVAVVEIKGPIFDSKEIVDSLDRVYKKDQIKALILRIDSPGGAVGPSQEIYQAVLRVRTKKKVVASLGGVAASGGYYIAVGANKIVANPGTITGSIGVLMDYTNIQDLLQFLKIHAEVLKAGEMKDVGSPLRPLTPDERKYLHELLANMHQQFKNAVATQRHLSQEKINEIADGRVFTGEQALALGLVDQLGFQQTAVDLVKELLGTKEEPRLVYPKKKQIDYLDLLTGNNLETIFNKSIYTLKQGKFLYWTKGISL